MSSVKTTIYSLIYSRKATCAACRDFILQYPWRIFISTALQLDRDAPRFGSCLFLIPLQKSGLPHVDILHTPLKVTTTVTACHLYTLRAVCNISPPLCSYSSHSLCWTNVLPLAVLIACLDTVIIPRARDLQLGYARFIKPPLHLLLQSFLVYLHITKRCYHISWQRASMYNILYCGSRCIFLCFPRYIWTLSFKSHTGRYKQPVSYLQRLSAVHWCTFWVERTSRSFNAHGPIIKGACAKR